MAAIETHGAYPESPMDVEDVVYPCKGCGEILEEGKAFELAGNRWHIDCFRCNTCGTLLDSDANLLLLGDGSLICNNCTYSCNACGNKIEDLAILTGDQAFCSGCFRCRNCKRKIENLRYARTSQGIFCMSCHESLMARRRKKAKTPKANGGRSDKALPSLPPGAANLSNAFTPELDTPDDSHSESHTPQPVSPKENLAGLRSGQRTGQSRRDASPLSGDTRIHELHADVYNPNRTNDTMMLEDDDGLEQGFLPMAFDPTPIAGPSPNSIPRKMVPRANGASPPIQKENLAPRDYFGTNARLSTQSTKRDLARDDERPSSLRSLSGERDPDRIPGQPKASPHILFQDKGRTGRTGLSSANTPLSGSTPGTPIVGSLQDKSQSRKVPGNEAYALPQGDGFKLQEVPKSKRRSSSADLSALPIMKPIDTPKGTKQSPDPASPDSASDVNPFDDPKRKEAAPHAASAAPPKSADRSLPLRGDSLAAVAGAQSKQSKVDSPTSRTTFNHTPTIHTRHVSASSVPSPRVADSIANTLNKDVNRSMPIDNSASRTSFDAVPPRAVGRNNAAATAGVSDNFVAPRLPPPLPSATFTPYTKHRQHESISTTQNERTDASQPLASAGLPKFSSDGVFSMDDEMGRIMRGDTRDKSTDAGTTSVLRRVSNAVKHGRSFSDREASKSTRTPGSGSIDISSPLPSVDSRITTPASGESVEQLRASLRRAQQRVAELETEKLAMHERMEGASDIRAMNTELTRKRETMTELDRQREVVMRELVIIAENLKKSKDGHWPFDLSSLQTVVLKEFADSLQELKDSLGPQIEELMKRRNELTDEIANLIQMKDKGFQEYESLSSKNAQLMQHNNELLRGIKDIYNDNRQPQASAGANGLGIYNAGRSDISSSTDRNMSLAGTESSMSNLLQDDGQPATILEGPQMINIRKGIKPTKFNWRKGGEKVAKGVTKGIKAIAGTEKGPEPGQYSIGLPYNQTQVGGASMDPSGIMARKDVDGKGFGFFGPKNGNLKTGNGLGHLKSNSNNNLVASDGSTLFGSELSLRCEFENRLIPSLVTRCIQEVESRGMDVEGVYRKSGGAGQVKQVQQGFEKDLDFDISDPDLDIHSVTSTLKQYFRKLPTPLIAYDVYELLLEAGQLQSDKEKQAIALRAAIAELPDAHRDTLQYLVQHLARVMSHEPINLMTPLNLAVVFAPTIMRPLSIEREMTDMQTQRVAVQALLEHHAVIFDSLE